jgi:hypothetical protein
MDGNLHQMARRIQKAGMDFDFIDTRDLIDSKISGGRLSTPHESYPVLVIPPGAVMCPEDIERTDEFAASGGTVLAFEPLSDFALPEVASPPNGRDRGPGKSPAQMIRELLSAHPDRVKLCSLEDNWPALVKQAADSDVNIDLDGDYLAARQSVMGDTRFVLIANGSREDAKARVEFPAGRRVELWDPWTGELSDFASNVAEVDVEGYSAIILAAD